MPESKEERQGVILLAMGGPDNLSDVGSFLYNIFSDRNIIHLPGGTVLQKPLAALISRMRRKSVEEHYKKIGGGSPLLKWTNAQRDHIIRFFSESGQDVPCYVGMRYFRPTIATAIETAYNDGCRKLIFVPMYPQYCRATTGSSFEEAKKELSRFNDVQAEFINDFHDHPAYLTLLREHIGRNIRSDDALLFSAHSIPQKFVDGGDPYVDQVKRTAELVAVDREYYLSFQSRTGPVKWVGPDTIDESIRLASGDHKGIYIVPVSFVCDHIETLFEIDIELFDMVKKETGVELKRMSMFNGSQAFAQLLVDLIKERVAINVS